MPAAVIRISGDFDDAALRKAQLAIKKLGMNVDATGKSSGKSFDGMKVKTVALGAAIARVGTDIAYWLGRNVTNTFKDSIAAASDYNETLSKTQVIFGKNADAITKFADTAATAYGQTKTQAMNAAATFGMFGQSAGLTGTKLTGFSNELTGLASDLASFNNTSVDEAITALGAALRGESEPIRRFNVLLDDATLRQEAMALGIVKTTKKALTPQQRVLAAHSVIMKQTRLQQGDFARTSQGLANQQRILAAQFGNLKIQLGQFFLPIITQVVTFMTSKVMPIFEKFASTLGEKVQPAIDALKPAFEALGKFVKDNFDKIITGLGLLAAAFAAFGIGTFIAGIAAASAELGVFGAIVAAVGGPIAAIALALAALAGIFIYAWNTSQEFRNKVKEAASAVGAAFEALGRIFSTLGQIIGAFLKPAFEGLKAILLGIAMFFINVFKGAAQGVAWAFNFIADALERNKEPLMALFGFFGKIFEIVGKLLGPVLAWLGEVVGTILKLAFMAIGVAIGLTIDAIGLLVRAVQAVYNFIAPILIPILKVFWTVLTDIANAVMTPLKAAFGWLANIVGAVLSVFFKALWEVLKLVFGVFSDIATTVLGVVKTALVWLSEHLAGNLLDGWNSIKDIVNTVIDILKVPLTAALTLAGEAFTALKDLAMGVFDNIKGFVQSLWDKLIEVKDKLVTTAKTFFSPLYDAFKGVINSIISAWNRLDFAINITVPDWVPVVGGKGFHVADIFPDIPMLADGGIVTRPTLAMIGEAGPEAVIPLSGSRAQGMGITIAPGAVQVTIGSLDGMNRSAIQDIVDEAFKRSINQLARDIKARR